MSGLRLLPLGVGNAFSATSYSTCLALECNGHWLLLDCPHPIRKMMREASRSAQVELDIPQVDAVAVTHLHADHISGLEGMAFYSRFLLERPLRLLAHDDVVRDLWPGHLAASMQSASQGPGKPALEKCFSDYFEFHSLHEEQPVTIGPFSIWCRAAIHTLPTTALFIEAAGRKFAFSADTAFSPPLIEWLSRADFIVHDSNGDFPHTPYDKLAALPADLRKKLFAVHYPDDFNPPNRLVELLQQGQKYTV